MKRDAQEQRDRASDYAVKLYDIIQLTRRKENAKIKVCEEIRKIAEDLMMDMAHDGVPLPVFSGEASGGQAESGGLGKARKK